MGRSAEPFRDAIKQSLERNRVQGVQLTRAKVIEDARFPDGRPVGHATLYRKNKRGEFVHRDLLMLLDTAISPNIDVRSASGRGELTLENRELKQENAALVDQIVTQHQEKVASRAESERAAAKAKYLGVENYVLASLLCEVVPELVMARRIAATFETNYANSYELEEGKKLLRDQLNTLRAVRDAKE